MIIYNKKGGALNTDGSRAAGQPEFCVISSEHHCTKRSKGKIAFSSSTRRGNFVAEKWSDVQAPHGRLVLVFELD